MLLIIEGFSLGVASEIFKLLCFVTKSKLKGSEKAMTQSKSSKGRPEGGQYLIHLDEAMKIKSGKEDDQNTVILGTISCPDGGSITMPLKPYPHFFLRSELDIAKEVIKQVPEADWSRSPRELVVVFPAEALHQVAGIVGAKLKE
jgi:hypothetical protein